jgi:hypothetical protein
LNSYVKLNLKNLEKEGVGMTELNHKYKVFFSEGGMTQGGHETGLYGILKFKNKIYF